MLFSLPAWLTLYVFPPLFTLGFWVVLTAGVMLLNRRGARAARIGLVATVPLVAFAHHLLWSTRDDLSIAGAYAAFGAGLLIWAWHELAFYSGVLSGPWRAACPPHARGFIRFQYALGTHLYHELACLIELIFFVALLHNASNMLGPLAFGLSWALQHSAKLNVLLGVRSLDPSLFPAHMRYLGSYWRRRAGNAFFLPSLSVATLLAIMLWLAVGVHADDPAGVRLALIATLISLGAIEHIMLVLPPLRLPVPAAGQVAE
jgi:putative photosynthetic complex assembly protein 2